MTIKKINGKFYLLSDEGYILHSENTLDNMWKWCNEYFAYSLILSHIGCKVNMFSVIIVYHTFVALSMIFRYVIII